MLYDIALEALIQLEAADLHQGRHPLALTGAAGGDDYTIGFDGVTGQILPAVDMEFD